MGFGVLNEFLWGGSYELITSVFFFLGLNYNEIKNLRKEKKKRYLFSVTIPLPHNQYDYNMF